MGEWLDNPWGNPINPRQPGLPLDGPATLNLEGDSEAQVAEALAVRTQRDGVQGWYHVEAWRANEILRVGKSPAAPKPSCRRIAFTVAYWLLFACMAVAAGRALALQVFA